MTQTRAPRTKGVKSAPFGVNSVFRSGAPDRIRTSTNLIENCAKLPFEHVLRQRFLQHLDAGIDRPLIEDGLARISRHDQHSRLRLARLHFCGELTSAHS